MQACGPKCILRFGWLLAWWRREKKKTTTSVANSECLGSELNRNAFLRFLGSDEDPDPYLHVSAASGSDKMRRIHANPDPQL
jgi:hypothetical protein